MDVQELKAKIEKYEDELYGDVRTVLPVGCMVCIKLSTRESWAKVIKHDKLDIHSLVVENPETGKIHWIDISYIQDKED